MIKNLNKNAILAKRIKQCDTSFKKAQGLMFTMQDPELGVIFPFDSEEMIAIHMLFVFYPIDVLWLDEGRKVIWMKKDLKPFTPYYKPKFKGWFLIELRSGIIEESKTEIGDVIFWD